MVIKTKIKSVSLCLLIFIFLILLPNCNVNLKAESEIYFRLNQVGFLPGENKSAVILSNTNLDGFEVKLKNVRNNQIVYSQLIRNSFGSYGNFKFAYKIDFTSVTQTGDYLLEAGSRQSFPFTISNNVNKGIAELLLDFFKIQRCGYTNPQLRNVCHIADATSIIDGKRTISQTVDLTGGWHDAGDYIKFLNTTAYSTYILLFAYEFDPQKFGFDNDKNGSPDILEEAKIGLDWMIRASYKNDKFVTQVQDLRDHEVGWRMPEDDPLEFDRPGFLGIGKNLIGIYSATMAIASRIWRGKFQYIEFADKCLDLAERYYSIRNRVPDIDSSGTGMYLDNSFEGKMALGAVELYLTNNKPAYLNEAKVYADSAGSDFWWSWGNINSIAHYRLASFDTRYKDFIKNSLEHFSKNMENNLFGLGTSLSWGTNNTLLGITFLNILWSQLSGDNSFSLLATIQKDFILGRNPWGISFIYNVGENFTRNFHHQISHIKGKLNGGFAAGPATKEFLKNYNIIYENPDKYAKFQTSEMYYRDERVDYITNEPTISANATAIFVFGNLVNR
ncbi:MAG: glycoside hydrolase family 9 protein [Bacteroidota bacterium]